MKERKRRKNSVKSSGYEIRFSEKVALNQVGESEVVHLHVHGAHSHEDSMVYFPKENMLYTGNIFHDIIGQHIDHVIKALRYVLHMANDDTRILPGHGLIIQRNDLKAFKDWVLLIKSKVLMAKEQGMELDELQTLNLATDTESVQRLFNITPGELIKCIYHSN